MNSLNTSVGFEFSINQKEIWNLSNINNYFNQMIITVEGQLDKKKLIESINSIIKKHEVLSSKCLVTDNSIFPFQISFKEAEIDFHESDSKENEFSKIIEHGNEYLSVPYDPSLNEPIRFFLRKISDRKHLLMVRIYALWGDSYSSIFFYKELCREYFNIEQEHVAKDTVEYRNFSQWQNDLVNEPDQEALRFWENYNCFLQVTNLPFGKNNSFGFSPRKLEIDFFSEKKYTELKNIVSRFNTTISDLLLSLFGVYLSNFIENEFTIGYIPFKRNYQELDATLGLVSKALPIKFNRNGIKTIKDTVEYVGKVVDEVKSWGDYFYLDKTNNTSCSFFQYCFECIELNSNEIVHAPGSSFDLTHIYSITDSFSIKLFCIDYGDKLTLELYYDGNKFNDLEIDILVSQIKCQFQKNTDRPVNEFSLSDKEKALIISSNATGNGLNTDRGIITLFEEQAEKTPDNIALVYEDHSITYKELNERSNQLAHYLREAYNVRNGDLIGIMLERSEWIIIGLLGIMKSGAAYVPIDPAYPRERIDYILKDSNSKLLISEKEFFEKNLFETEIDTLYISEKGIYKKTKKGPLKQLTNANDLAYIIYTSGSTGNPKGCMINHRNLSNYIQWSNEYYFESTQYGNWGVITPVSFDLTVTSLYTALTRGKKLYLGSRNKEIIELLEESFANPGIDTLKLTPSHLSLLKGMDIPETNIRIIICGGEQLTQEQVNAIWNIKKEIRIYNEYGPTETTVGSVVKEIEKDEEKILIGKPIGNTEIYILKENNAMTPVGVLGEIHIGGAGLGSGYLNRPELTEEKFITHPFKKNQKLYKTGDLGRWLPNGNIDFTGRNDDQVKIRGYRIELGEIEDVLRRYQGISSAVVITRSNTEGEQELVAYITVKEELNALDIRSYLSKSLPAYMLPVHFVQLEKIPLTPNGKIDKKALPSPDAIGMHTGREYVAPRNAIEEKLINIWKELLSRKRIGIKDNFFEIGGHSLKATKLAGYIHKEFEVKIGLKELFANAVLEEQALLIERSVKTSFNTILPAATQPSYALSSSQHRLWVLSQFEEGSIAYNISGAYVFEGDLDYAALEYSFTILQERHESLRTVFKDTEEGEVRQFINSVTDTDFRIAYQDLRTAKELEKKLKELVHSDLMHPFDLSEGPLLRSTLYQVEDQKWVFTYVIHHIISDGWSMRILIKELLLLYNAFTKGEVNPLTPLRIHYKDYAIWQKKQLSGAALYDHKSYWLKQFEGTLPMLELPIDKARPAMQTYNGQTINRLINAKLSKGIKSLSHEQGGTLFMGLLAAITTLLYRYTSQEDIVIGTPIAGREHADLEDQIGFYINTLAMRMQFKGKDTYKELFHNIKQVTLGAYEHQVYPFEELVDTLHLQRDLSRNVLFDVMVLLQNTELNNTEEKQDLSNINVKKYEGGNYLISKYDLTFYFKEEGENILTKIEYNSDIFHRERIERLGDYLERLLETIISYPIGTIDQLVHLSERSRHQRPLKIKDISGSKISCSEHQKRLWFVDQFEKGYLYEKSPVYHNLPLIVKITEELNIESFNKSLGKVLKSHTILRTKISTQNGEPFQLINEDIESRVQQHTIENFVKEADLIKKCLEIIHQPFDIEKDLLIRFDLINYNSGSSLLLITAHHLVTDRKSLRILFNEIINDYKGLSKRAGNASVLRYAHFSEWQNELYNDLEPLSFYWNKKLKDAPVLYLETDRQRDHIHVFEADLVSRTFTKELADKVENFCKRQDTSHFIFLLTAFKALLHRYTGSEEIVIGTLCENRVQEGLSNMIGPVSNLITVKNKIEGNTAFEDLLRQVSLDYNNSMEFSGIPFEKVVLEVNPEKDMSRTALFDVLIHYEEEVKQERIDEEFEILELNYGLGKYDINLLIKKDTHLGCYLTFNKKYFDRSRIEKTLDHYVRIIENVLETPSQPINEIDYLGSAEKYQLLIGFNDTSAAYPKDKTIVSLFEEQVEKTPDNLAIVFQETELTYKELNERSNQLGVYLREKYKIKANDFIGIKLERSEWMVIAILGILKSGGAYVPVDPNYPQQRIDYMLTDSNCKVVIDEQELECFRKAEKKYVKKNLKSINKPEDLAYVIYTSGTTGNPKGSLIEHKNVVRLFKTDRPLFDFSSADVWTMFHSYCFDFSVWEMYGALLFGGKLIIIPSIIAKDPEAYIDVLNKQGVTVLNQTPSSFYTIIKQDLEKEGSDLHLRYVIFGGDALSPEKLKGWRNKYPETKLINMYGITETTVHVTYKEITEEDIERKISNIGKPIPTLSCYILDRNKNLLPVGVSGEIYVSGDGLARGYLNKPELTSEKFISNPFKEGERMYKTGDLGRWLPDGNIEFAGRKDDQVKIRGYRIELGEIENAIQSHSDIDSTIVIARSNKAAEKELIAYAVSKENLNISEIRTYLGHRLPSYMIPSYFVQIASLPLTSNGKIDKKRLPDPEDSGMSTGIGYAAPTNETEAKLVLIWQEILGREKIGIKDNFFEIGGHSLKATRLASHIYKEFEVKVSLRELFVNAVLEEQAKLIERSGKTLFSNILPVAQQSSYRLSSSQHRLWVLSQFKEGNIAYNIPGAFIFEGDLDYAALEYAFTILQERHESLRTVFKEEGLGEIRQYINSVANTGFRITCKDLRTEREKKGKLKDLVQSDFMRPFDLTSGPLIRVVLYQVEDHKWVFSYVMHHIISDGWSMRILIKELLLLYNAFSKGEVNPLTPLRIHYKDYATWQQEQLSGKALKDHKAYWLKQFEGDLPSLEFPGDKLRPVVKTFNGGVINRRINSRLSNEIKSLSQKQGSTLFMSLLAAVTTLLYRYTGQEDIIMGSPVAGREHIDLEDQIGFYVNTLALRMRFNEGDNFQQLLKKAKQITLEAYEHQLYPFDELVDNLSFQKDMSRNALFDVMIVLHNTNIDTDTEKQSLGDIKVNKYEDRGHEISKFDLTFNFTETRNEIHTSIEYNSDIYQKDTIERLGEHLEQLIESIIEFPEWPISQLNYISEQEKSRLLMEFNATIANYPKSKTLVSLFEEQVKHIPDHVALIFEDKQFTYKELNELSNQLGGYLRKNYKIKPDDLVAIKLERSERMILSILGVLKSGAAYVPIDPDYPEERINYMLEDSNCKVLIDEKELEKFKKEEKKYKRENLKSVNKPDDLVYVIYTSGSTGRPKGCMLENRGVINRIEWMWNQYGYNSEDSILQKTTFTFDVSVWEIFMPLCWGTKMVLCQKEDVISPERVLRLIERHKITCLHFVPSIFNVFISTLFRDINAIKSLSSLTKVITSGEALSTETVRQWYEKTGIVIHNLYGPTEASIDVTYFATSKNDLKIPIGCPIWNTQMYILDEHHQLCAIGVIGEICIGGDGLARGYLNKPELTEQKFVSNPFKEGERMYKTGDLGRWLLDGNIEFVGRKDNQVKIRGYRIELGEIENALQSHIAIDSAVVIDKYNQEKERELVAYITGEEVLNASDIRVYLSGILPNYMIPGHFVQLDELPITSSGKIDRKRLPESYSLGIKTGVSYIAPRNELERHLVTVFEEVLKKTSIGIKEDFFVLGGDSIKSIQIVSRLKQKGYLLAIQDVLLYPVIENLAKRVKIITRLIDQGIVEGIVPFGPIQLSFLENNLQEKHHYNQSILLCSKDQISEKGLRHVLDKILLHHDVLRMVYRQTPFGWVQENKGAEQSYLIEVIENADEETFILHCEQVQSSMDLTHGPLFKVCLFRGANGDRLLLVAHHLIIDGVSWRILLDDLSSLYQQYLSGEVLHLPFKTDSFKYWMDKQIAYSQSEALQKEELYWSAMESIFIEPLPIDHPEGSNLMKHISSRSFLLNERLTEKLLTQCYKAYHTEINDIVLTALSLALKETFGLNKILINLEGHGREFIGADIDVTRTIGWFTTMYPVIFDMSYNGNIIRQLIEVKESLHRVPNKGIGYGILRYLKGKEYKFKPEITFNYLGDFGSGLATKQGDQLFEFLGDYHGREHAEDMQRDVVLDVSGIVVAGKIRLLLNYSNKHYKASTIEGLLVSYEKNLTDLIEQLSKEEKTHLSPVDLTYKDLSIEQVQELNKDYNIEDVYPLSPLQEGLYYHWLSSAGSPVYFEQMSYRVKGNLDLTLLEKSYQILVFRHAVLRTFFIGDLGEIPLQVVKKSIDPSYKFHNISETPHFSIEEYKKSDRSMGFDLRKGSQMRLMVLGISDNTYEFIWSHHHILMDGWCVSILIKEFFQIYYSLLHGKLPELNEVYPYSGYIEWLSTINKENSLKYWKNYLSGYDTTNGIPKLSVKEPQRFQMQERIFAIKDSIRQSINTLCTDLGITENIFIQAVWGILLGRYNSTEDIVFGSVVSGRPPELEGVEEMIGLFINTIPVRIRMKEEMTVKKLLKEAQQNAIEGTNHHYIQLAEIQSASELGRNLFDHIMIFENYPVQERIKQDIEAQNNSGKLSLLLSEVVEQTNYDFTFTIFPGDIITIRFNYNETLYDEALITRLQNHFIRITEQVIKNPAIAINKIAYLSDTEKDQILYGFNDTAMPYPSEETLISLFEKQVEKKPDTIAVVCNGVELSYRELNERSNQLADYLRKTYFIKPNDLLGIKLDRSEWMIISILGVLKSGGVYVPIDPEYPKERIDYIMEDSTCKVLIDEDELLNFKQKIKKYTDKNQVLYSKPNDLVYVIYTSGSTGRPKGCMLENKGVINRVEWMWKYYGFTSEDVILQKTTFTFDVSVWEIFMPLCWGAKMVLCQKEDVGSPERIASLIEKYKITCLHFVPAMLNAFINFLFKDLSFIKSLNSLKRLIASGEALSTETVKKWYEKIGVTIHNLYGPTEASVDVTYYETLKGDTKIPIGRPIWNTQMYILDEHHQLCAIGVTGEICIGGIGLARGYLNKPELTTEKFVANPFKNGERIYKTGDLGRWLPDGNIEYIGRKDDQVKIRGYRIELGEIESILQNYHNIDSAVVIARPTIDGEKELIAYITVKKKLKIPELNTFDIRSYLSKSLPVYMLPGHFVQMGNLPLTPNGKIDKKRLPDPEELGLLSGIKYVAPRNAIEEKLIFIWQQLLNKEKIGVKDNFFELGGHSLTATRLVSQVNKKFEIKVALNEILAKPILEEQAKLIEQASKTFFMDISPVAIQSNYPLSSSQYWFWALSQVKEINIAYNMPKVYVFEGNLNPAALEYAFKTLIERHESLRTVFKEDERGEVKQFIHSVDQTTFDITYHDLQENDEQQATVKKLIQEDFIKPFNLASGPLLRADLYQVASNKWIFTYVIHHIISDGVSMHNLIKEVLFFYDIHLKDRVNPLLPLRIQYKDYAAWQQKQLTDDVLNTHKTYWLKQFEGNLPVLELPTDRVRPALKTYNGDVINKRINAKLSNGIKTICREHDCTLFMGLLAVVNTLLHRYTGQEDIIIGCPVAGRDHVDLENQIGVYLNALALRTHVKGENSYTELLENVKQVTLGAYEHQVYPFHELVEKLDLPPDMSRNPLYDVLVMLFNTNINHESEVLSSGELKIRAFEEQEYTVSKLDLTFAFAEIGEELQLSIEYNSDLFDKATVLRVGNNLVELIDAVIKHPLKPVQQLDYLSPEEKQKILVEFNNIQIDFPENKTIVDLFEEQVKKTPNDVACVFEENGITYKELNERSNRLGNYLRENYQVKSNDFVGILLDNNGWMAIAIFAVLKAGGAYVPIYREDSTQYNDFMLQDSKCSVWIDKKEIEKFKKEEERYKAENFLSVSVPGDVAFAAYTSDPGKLFSSVLINNNSLVNYIVWNLYDYQNGANNIFIDFLNAPFDHSIEKIYQKVILYRDHYILSNANIESVFSSAISDEFE
jgi:amino acid adenylation domain-containing protein/non-ribosomal peptide synthase protein (TIGR01720 family)